MPKICLTAGPSLADVLWASNVLPHLRRSMPSACLAWECSTPGAGEWLQLYPELDEVVSDIEAMSIAPDIYLILHPLWLGDNSLVAGLFAAIKEWCPPPECPPHLPYCPRIVDELPPLADLPEVYICFDPNIQPGGTASEGTRHDLAAVLANLPLPAVQMGAKDCPLLPFAIDARGNGAFAASRAIRHASLFIGGDCDASVLASGLGARQVWIEPAGNVWWWPRGVPPASSRYKVESADFLDVPSLSELARTALQEPGARP